MRTKYSREEAEEIIRDISCSPKGAFIPSWHASEESGPARNFDPFDALQVLRTGHVVSEPEYISEYKNWKCKMEGQDIEGDNLTLVVAFDPKMKRVYVITGW